MTLKDLSTGQDVSADFDFCIGADGAFSTVRRQMMRVVRSVIGLGSSFELASLTFLPALMVTICLE